MTRVNGDGAPVLRDAWGEVPDHAMALLGLVMDALRRGLDEAGRAVPEGGRPQEPALRSSQLRLLSLTPPEGLRLTDLAARLGITKQALGELADDLERRGLLESVRDPSDRRVRVLRPTAGGHDAVRRSNRLLADVERDLRARVGPDRWDLLRSLLLEAAVAAGGLETAERPEPAPTSAGRTLR